MSGGSARSLGKGEACPPRSAIRDPRRPSDACWGQAAPERSHAGGSAPPGQVPEGLIRVYSMRFCPFAKRTLLVLKAKGIGHEVININLKNKPEWFFKKNPFGLVPVLENSQGQVIYESAITCEYLDEAYPGKKLLPDDPYEKACQKMVFELFSKVLTNKKTAFFGGSSLSMIDYLIWPWFEWLVALELNEYVDHTPNLKLWMAAMMKDPAVSSLFIDPKAFRGFLDLYLQNNLEACDYGL
ncbi:glutathione S-transferase omega-1 isoform X3 [Physeter macrocephalus]|uniref:Glutathione S-transferase omega n=1 Tax=Physeter macrocephalus TaxID=9755 RepID=A0A9W2WCD3_PHYMC|nr:glutathione S-transferase omega-1 isoform X3 [Physeter catodon]